MASRSLFQDSTSSFGGKRKGVEGDLDITPMIDVTFLLLIFFMVSSTMQGKPDLDVPVAQHAIGIDAAGAAVVTVFAAASVAESPRIVLGDVQGPDGELSDIRGYVEEKSREGIRKIVIKAEGDVPHGLVEEIAKAIKSVEGVELYMGVGDKPVE
ncbi:MAG: biopolymer transporter ExbD [Planctomycetaceae bacterium]